MSIKVMHRIWEHAPQKESTLLLLLALADYADDNGICWPDVATLAAKARISERRAIDIIRDLEATGAIAFERGGGRGKKSRYAVLVGLSESEKERVKEIHRNYFSEIKTVKPGVKGEGIAPIKNRKGELQRQERVNYSVNSDRDLPQQDAPNPDPIRHVDPSCKNLDLESESKVQDSPARTQAVLAYFEFFPGHTLTAAQVKKINETVTGIAQWRAVLEEWALNNWNGQRIPKMLDRYSSGRTAKDERPASGSGHGNGQRAADARPPPPVFVPAADRPDAQASRSSLAEIARTRKP
jgi:hypothetical protein